MYFLEGDLYGYSFQRKKMKNNRIEDLYFSPFPLVSSLVICDLGEKQLETEA